MKREISGKNTIRRSIRRKLGSDAGASITFALLLFLVCAMVSAVVLVAATTAAGRMASIAEADQRYYAVTSAAELIRDAVSDKTVTVMTFGSDTIVVAKPANEITAENINDAGGSADEDSYIPAGDDDTDYQHVTRPDTESVSDGSLDSLLRKVSELVLANEKSFGFDISVLSGGEDRDELAVHVDVTVSNDDKATFVIYNTNGKPFKMTMDFSVDTKNNNPAVTGVNPTSSKEISWHLDRVITSYDASIMD